VGTEALTPRESETPGPSIFILSNSNFGRTLSLNGLYKEKKIYRTNMKSLTYYYVIIQLNLNLNLNLNISIFI